MKDKTKLIQALRVVGKRLADGCAYSWNHGGRCNMGLLARELVGIAEDNDRFNVPHSKAMWGAAARIACETTGEPMSHVLQTLFEAGLSVQDISDLEWLSRIDICKKAGIEESTEVYNTSIRFINSGRDNRQTVSRYMLAWADLLEEEAGEAFELRPLALTVKEGVGV